MRKGHGAWVLLISVFGAVLICLMPVVPLGPFASVGAGNHPSSQVAFRNGSVGLSGPEEGIRMLQFKARGHILGFQPKKVYFASLDHALSIEFLGTPGVMPRTVAGGKETDKDPKIPFLGRVVYEDLWEGISLTYEARDGGIAESTYRIGPWADVSKIRLGYNVPVELQGDGSLKFRFDRGYLRESPPKAWQEVRGERVPVEVGFRVTGGEVGFKVGKYDRGYQLTIDPIYSWHTFYGSYVTDVGSGIVIDSDGSVYVAGTSSEPWYGPAGQYPINAYHGDDDLFVVKFNKSGAYQWHTFYGSNDRDDSEGIAIDSSGSVYVTGSSLATWYGPGGKGPLHDFTGGWDLYVLKLSGTGAYQWHTFYGSSGSEFGYGIATDSIGNLYVTGISQAWNGPAGETPLHAHSGSDDISVLKLDSYGAYKWHTFYGSNEGDQGIAIATDSSGNLYVTGYSRITWNGPAGETPLHACSLHDIFVLKLTSSGNYQWHTFYGSTNVDYGYAIAIDRGGNIYTTGSRSDTWYGPSGEDPLHADGESFVLKLDSYGAYQWHTFYGATFLDGGYGIAIDGSGNLYVTGLSGATWSGPAGQDPLHAYSGSEEIYVLKLSSTGAYQWHTFYGSNGQERGTAIATDNSGNVYVTGYGFKTWNGPAGETPLHDFTGSGHQDFFVLKLSGKLIMAVKGSTNNYIYLRKMTNGAWDPWETLSGITSHAPAMAEYNGRLYMSVKGTSNKILVRSMDSSGAWSSWSAVPGQTTLSPALVAFNDHLWIGVKGATNNNIYLRSMNASGIWSGWLITVPGGGTSDTPALVVFNGRLYLFVKGATNNNIYRKSMDSSGAWSSWVQISPGTTSVSPSAVVYGNRIYLFVKGATNNNIYYTRSEVNNTSTWDPWVMLSGATNQTPSLSVNPEDGLLYISVKGATNNTIYYRSMDPQGVWSSWFTMSGATTDSPFLSTY